VKELREELNRVLDEIEAWNANGKPSYQQALDVITVLMQEDGRFAKIWHAMLVSTIVSTKGSPDEVAARFMKTVFGANWCYYRDVEV